MNTAREEEVSKLMIASAMVAIMRSGGAISFSQAEFKRLTIDANGDPIGFLVEVDERRGVRITTVERSSADPLLEQAINQAEAMKESQDDFEDDTSNEIDGERALTILTVGAMRERNHRIIITDEEGAIAMCESWRFGVDDKDQLFFEVRREREN